MCLLERRESGCRRRSVYRRKHRDRIWATHSAKTPDQPSSRRRCASPWQDGRQRRRGARRRSGGTACLSERRERRGRGTELDEFVGVVVARRQGSVCVLREKMWLPFKQLPLGYQNKSWDRMGGPAPSESLTSSIIGHGRSLTLSRLSAFAHAIPEVHGRAWNPMPLRGRQTFTLRSQKHIDHFVQVEIKPFLNNKQPLRSKIPSGITKDQNSPSPSIDPQTKCPLCIVVFSL